jgi:hypothetical protein
VVEFDFVVLQMFVAVLASIVVATNNSNFCPKRNVPTRPAKLFRFRETFCREDYGTDVSKNGALHFCNRGGNRFRIVARSEFSDRS